MRQNPLENSVPLAVVPTGRGLGVHGREHDLPADLWDHRVVQRHGLSLGSRRIGRDMRRHHRRHDALAHRTVRILRRFQLVFDEGLFGIEYGLTH